MDEITELQALQDPAIQFANKAIHDIGVVGAASALKIKKIDISISLKPPTLTISITF